MKITARIKNIIVKFSLTVLAIVSSLLSPAVIFAATLSLSPATGTINRGCNFTLSIVLDTQGSNTDGTDAIIKYDPQKVNPTKINNGTIYQDYPGSFIDAQASKINVSGLATVASPFNGKGVLATVDFSVPQTAPTGLTQLTFDFDPNDKAKTTDSNVVERGTVSDVLSDVTNGSYTVGTGACSTGLSLVTGGTGGTFGSLSGQGATDSGKTIDDLTGGGKPSGAIETTIILTFLGVILTILGILGLALL
ncbi:hypothetical protein HYS93_04015 [Candidatus Daviesbacteria bacterium]|nr:hypothetical protein [Candidatus Daviesbacteria bacterium]